MIGNIALYKDDHEDISIKNNKKRDNLKKKIIDVLTSIFAFLWVSYELQKRNNDEFTTELVFCWFGIFCLKIIVVVLQFVIGHLQKISIMEDHMKNQDTYKNKVQNLFTAYVLRSVEGKRMKYLAKQSRRETYENFLEDELASEPHVGFDELYEQHFREKALDQEAKGRYPEWGTLSDGNLTAAIQLLQPEERKLLYLHIFEEKSFEQISMETETPQKKVENRYYYAIKKIRKWIQEKGEI